MTDKTYAEGMAVLFAAFRKIFSDMDYDAQKRTQLVWKELLKDMSDDEYMYAIKKVCRDEQIYPSTNVVSLIRDQVRKDPSNEAIFAWEKVLQAIRKGSRYSVKFDDPVIHSVLELMGGWTRVDLWKEDDMIWKKKEFCDLYPVMATKKEHKEYLPGVFEIQNSFRGFEYDEPICIGSKVKIKQIPKKQEKLVDAIHGE